MFTADQESNAAYYGGGTGFGGGTGMFAMIILVVIVLWVLFSKDGKSCNDGYGYGNGCAPYYGYNNGCGPCVQTAYKDESNWEQESHLKDKLCCMDKDILKTDNDVWKTACETQKEVHCEGETTRALIQNNYIQDLRDTITEKNAMIQTMKSEAFTGAEIAKVLGAINCTNQRIEKLECNIPQKAPLYAETVTCDTHHTDCDHRGDRYGYGNNYGNDSGYPRRGNYNNDYSGCGCCA